MKNPFLLTLLLCCFSFALLKAQDSSDAIPLCPSEAVICRVERTWTLTQLAFLVGNLEAGEGDFFAKDEQLVFVYRSSQANANQVSALFSDEVEMLSVEDSDLWTLTLQFEGIDEAILTLGIAERGSGNHFAYPLAIWRGENASPDPEENEPMLGSYEVIDFESEALDERRDVHLYLPPNHSPDESYPVVYMLDGEMLDAYAPAIDHLITREAIPALIVVGTASAQVTAERNMRGEEYVHARNPERYEQHEIFFTQEVRDWAEANYGASTERSKRIIYGVSNGGLFAIAMNLAHPDLYGAVFPFSAGAGAGFEPLPMEEGSIELPLYVYSNAGTLDPIFQQSTMEFAQNYEDLGAEVVFTERVSGHDDLMWRIEFMSAIQWYFESKGD